MYIIITFKKFIYLYFFLYNKNTFKFIKWETKVSQMGTLKTIDIVASEHWLWENTPCNVQGPRQQFQLMGG